MGDEGSGTVGNSGGGINVDTIITFKPPIRDIIFLFLSVALWVSAWLFLKQSVAFQRWVTSKDENAPDPKIGEEESLIFSVVVMILWCVFWFFFYYSDPIELS